MTYAGAWTIELARLDQSTDHGGVLQHETTTIKLGVISITKLGPNTEHGCHPNSVVMLPDTEAPHFLCALPMR